MRVQLQTTVGGRLLTSGPDDGGSPMRGEHLSYPNQRTQAAVDSVAPRLVAAAFGSQRSRVQIVPVEPGLGNPQLAGQAIYSHAGEATGFELLGCNGEPV
jgi:hypothetical protein